MYIIIPEEKKKLQRTFEPYLDGVKLREDAPQEVVEAYNEFHEWFGQELGMEQ